MTALSLQRILGAKASSVTWHSLPGSRRTKDFLNPVVVFVRRVRATSRDFIHTDQNRIAGCCRETRCLCHVVLTLWSNRRQSHRRHCSCPSFAALPVIM